MATVFSALKKLFAWTSCLSLKMNVWWLMHRCKESVTKRVKSPITTCQCLLPLVEMRDEILCIAAVGTA